MQLRRIALPLLVSLGAFPLLAQLQSPKAATIRYQDGSVRLILGLGSSYVVGSTLASGTYAAAFSDRFGWTGGPAGLSLLREDGSLVTPFPASEAQPVFSVGDTLDSAVAWLPSTSQLVSWNGTSLTATSVAGLPVSGLVTSVEKREGRIASLVIRTNDGPVFLADISLDSGNIAGLAALVDASGPTAFLGSNFVSLVNGKLRIFRGAGDPSPVELPFAEPQVRFETASSNSLHIASTGDRRNWLLYQENGRFQMAEIPAPRGLN